MLAAMPHWQSECHGVVYPDLRKWEASEQPTSSDERGHLVPDAELGVTLFDLREDARRHYTARDCSQIWEMGAEASAGLAVCSVPPSMATISVYHSPNTRSGTCWPGPDRSAAGSPNAARRASTSTRLS